MRVVEMRTRLYSVLKSLSEDAPIDPKLRPHLAALRLYLDTWVVPSVEYVYEELKAEHDSRSRRRRRHSRDGQARCEICAPLRCSKA